MQEVQTTLPIGTRLRDRYVVEGLLGKGGFGAVYLVRDRRVKGNLYALKEMIDSSKQERARFTFEGEVLKRLDHSALPPIYRVFEDDRNNRAYLLMDYIEGPNLETLRQRQPEKHFPLPRVMSIMAPIIDAVSYLHKQHPPIIHRDIKPANIIVPTDEEHAVLVDFGIAKEYDQDSTTTAVRRCSPGYGAPEHYSRGTNTRTDIYGLAATFYCLLTGFVPEDAFYRMTQLGSKGKDPLEPVHKLVPTIPLFISNAIQKAMSISSNDRFATVEQFWQALNAYPLEPPVMPLVSPSATTEVAPENGKRVVPVPLSKRKKVIIPPVERVPAASGRTTTSLNGKLPLRRARNCPLHHHRMSVPQDEFAIQATRKHAFLPLLFLLAALALGLGLAAAFWSSAGGHLFPSPVATTVVQQKTTATAHPISGVTPTATPTPHRAVPPVAPTPTPTPTPVPPAYPQVSGTHYGSVHNTTIGIDANMSVTLYQNQGNLSGNVVINPPLQGSGPIISGTVQTNNHIQFTVQGYEGHAPLFFSGTVNSNGSMSGSYCSLDVNTQQCSAAAGGQGTWFVNPASGPGLYSFSSESDTAKTTL